MTDLPNSVDSSLRARARKVVPGGMWGHQNAANLPENYPQFFARAEGARIWDVDGNMYRDFMCSWGPIVIGHRHPEVEAAVRKQLDVGDMMNGPGAVMVDLAELFVDTVAHADWVQFQKNGTDATTFCITVARAGTGRRKILLARGAYHGALAWSSPLLTGGTNEDRAHIIYYDYNDVASLQAAVAEAGDDLAGILASAFKHDYAKDQALPTVEFAQAARAACDAADAALMIDDVRAGFRVHIAGSWEVVGVRPDLSAWSKAIANGYALAAVTGNDRFREAATKLFSTGSFWSSSTSMAASLATLTVIRRDDAVGTMERLGTKLREGFASLSQAEGLSLRQTGPASMPMVLFDDDPEFRRANAFCSEALRHGAYFHPRHNMFLSAAHTDEDIEVALAAAAHGFAAAARV